MEDYIFNGPIVTQGSQAYNDGQEFYENPYALKTSERIDWDEGYRRRWQQQENAYTKTQTGH